MKAVLIRISTQEIIKKNAKYPSLVIEPIPSLEEDLEWLLVNTQNPPLYDDTIERLERVEEITTDPHPEYPLFNQYRIFYTIVTLSEQELDDKEDGEGKKKNKQDLQKGNDIFEKCYAKIWRRRHKDRDSNNKLTQGEARDLMEWFQPTYLWLKTGNFHQAKKAITNNGLIADITTANVVGMTNTYEWIRDQIINYFNNDYDL